MRRSHALPPPTRWRWLDWPAPARRVALGLFAGAATWLLLAPSRVYGRWHGLLAQSDKLVHALLFAALAGLTRWAAPAAWSTGIRGALLSGALVAYGAVIELVQPRLSGAGRAFEPGDIVADALGAIVGWILCRYLLADAPPPPEGASARREPSPTPRA